MVCTSSKRLRLYVTVASPRGLKRGIRECKCRTAPRRFQKIRAPSLRLCVGCPFRRDFASAGRQSCRFRKRAPSLRMRVGCLFRRDFASAGRSPKAVPEKRVAARSSEGVSSRKQQRRTTEARNNSRRKQQQRNSSRKQQRGAVVHFFSFFAALWGFFRIFELCTKNRNAVQIYQYIGRSI